MTRRKAHPMQAARVFVAAGPIHLIRCLTILESIPAPQRARCANVVVLGGHFYDEATLHSFESFAHVAAQEFEIDRLISLRSDYPGLFPPSIPKSQAKRSLAERTMKRLRMKYHGLRLARARSHIRRRIPESVAELYVMKRGANYNKFMLSALLPQEIVVFGDGLGVIVTSPGNLAALKQVAPTRFSLSIPRDLCGVLSGEEVALESRQALISVIQRLQRALHLNIDISGRTSRMLYLSTRISETNWASLAEEQQSLVDMVRSFGRDSVDLYLKPHPRETTEKMQALVAFLKQRGVRAFLFPEHLAGMPIDAFPQEFLSQFDRILTVVSSSLINIAYLYPHLVSKLHYNTSFITESSEMLDRQLRFIQSSIHADSPSFPENRCFDRDGRVVAIKSYARADQHEPSDLHQCQQPGSE